MTHYVADEHSQSQAHISASDKKLVERHYMVAGLAAMVAGVALPSAGLLGAMLLTTCLMVPMYLSLSQRQPLAAMILSVMGVVVLGPITYFIARAAQLVLMAAISFVLP